VGAALGDDGVRVLLLLIQLGVGAELGLLERTGGGGDLGSDLAARRLEVAQRFLLRRLGLGA